MQSDSSYLVMVFVRSGLIKRDATGSLLYSIILGFRTKTNGSKLHSVLLHSDAVLPF